MKIINPEVYILDPPDVVRENLFIIEKAIRTCYQSEPCGLDAQRKLFEKVIINGHESVLEHRVVTFEITTCRGITHEIVRHRNSAYSQESTRWCNYKATKFGSELTFVEPSRFRVWDSKLATLPEKAQEIASRVYDQKHNNWLENCRNCEKAYLEALSFQPTLGVDIGMNPEVYYLSDLLSPDKTDSARGVLINDLKSSIIWTMSFREIRHVLGLRTNYKAHTDFREIAYTMYNLLIDLYPSYLFEDKLYEPTGYYPIPKSFPIKEGYYWEVVPNGLTSIIDFTSSEMLGEEIYMINGRHVNPKDYKEKGFLYYGPIPIPEKRKFIR